MAFITLPILSDTEREVLDAITAGTVTASKALVVDANKDISILRNASAVKWIAGASGTVGKLAVFPATAAKGSLEITVSDQTGDTVVALNAAAMAAARTITIPDPGAAANVLMTTGTATAAGVSTAELDRIALVSARLVPAGATLTLTQAAHSDKLILWNALAGSIVTLPAASGSGMRFKLMISVLATSNSHIVKVANASDIIQGLITAFSDNAAQAQIGWATAADSDTITLNRTTSGGIVRGEWVELVDAATNLWLVTGIISQNGVEITPFSATV